MHSTQNFHSPKSTKPSEEPNTSAASFSFEQRHIGPNPVETQEMLSYLGLQNFASLIEAVIPKSIQSTKPLNITAMTEMNLLSHLQKMIKQNQVYHSMIGMGYYDTFTPTVIQRNILENPAWYTAYTPYQAEISQGRMEALLNFQTMIKDLTAMDISNSSLLDEGSAAAEAMNMAFNLTKKKNANVFCVSSLCHPHVVDVLKTRAEPLGIELFIGATEAFPLTTAFGILLQYPATDGRLFDYAAFTKLCHEQQVLVTVSADLMALTLYKPPGEWGADIVVGNSQRFGVPLGFGGPHAAFLATKDEFKRLIPGRLVGVSVDADQKPALRLALQTREQHIRREKATSNICTAQVLLANMASMFAVYHGPQGLRAIAGDISEKTKKLRTGLLQLADLRGFKVLHSDAMVFDTLQVDVSQKTLHEILGFCDQYRIQFRIELHGAHALIGISLNETTTYEILDQVLQIFNQGRPPGFSCQELTASKSKVEADLLRKSKYLTHPVFKSHHSETEMLRYIHSLERKDLSLNHSMIPLGSCTMKLNATTELMPLSWPEINGLHPFAPPKQTLGYQALFQDLEAKLCDITGFSGVSLQPNAGSQGEYAGLLTIRRYFQSRNEGHRNVCLIPSSAHGTNPATAAMAGMKVVVIACDTLGNVDKADLKAKAMEHAKDLAALMITYPSTHGVFEEGIVEICQIVHEFGGQVYMDGANLNALVGLCRPGEFGPDVSHMNLHKTFAIPHGGGGPGVGPIGVREHLKAFLPSTADSDRHGAVTSAPYGSASILPISWAYIQLMGGDGLKNASLVAILNANYMAKKLAPHFPILFRGSKGFVAHECIIDLREIKKTSGIDVNDLAKRLMDYGFHSPTMSWPVAGTLMIEPTESESKAELDRFCDAMIQIREEIRKVETKAWPLDHNPLVNAPHTAQMLLKADWTEPYSREEAAYPLAYVRANKFWPAVRRVDNAYGDRHIVCDCPPMSSYES